jgi:hypothetical protein
MPDPSKEQEYHEEAEGLRQLDKATQRQVIAIHRKTANNPKLGKRDRQAAAERADCLERLLKLTPPQKI